MNSSFLGIFEAKNNVLKLIVLASSQDFRKCCVCVFVLLAIVNKAVVSVQRHMEIYPSATLTCAKR